MNWIERYLTLLGVPPEAPSVGGLTALMQANVLRVPFSNVSAILRRAGTPSGRPVAPVDLDEQLRFWEEGTAGGVCFERTAMFGRLLEDLGYQAHTTLADASFPRSHQALVVSLPEGEFLADVGNGAPFYYPVSIWETSEVRHVGLVYRFRPGNEPYELLQERLINGEWSLFCTYDLRDPGAEVLELAYQRHHRPGESWVMDEFRLVRCTEEDVRSYRSGQFTHYTASGKRSEKLTDPASVVRLAVEEFGLPVFRVGEALRAQERFARAGISG